MGLRDLMMRRDSGASVFHWTTETMIESGAVQYGVKLKDLKNLVWVMIIQALSRREVQQWYRRRREQESKCANGNRDTGHAIMSQ